MVWNVGGLDKEQEGVANVKKRVSIILLFVMIVGIMAKVFAGEVDSSQEETDNFETETLKVAYIPKMKPLSFKNTETGQFDGIAREIFDKVSEVSGLKFEYVELPEGDISYEYLLENDIDLITGVEYNSTNVKVSGMHMSTVYLDSRKVLISKSETIFDKDKKFTVGVVTGSQTMKKAFKNDYPNAEIIDYDSIEGSFAAIRNGQVDFVLHNQYIAEYMLANPRNEGLKVVQIESIAHQQCFSAIYDKNDTTGVEAAEAAALIEIIDAALTEISEDEIEEIIIKETIENRYEYDFSDIAYKHRVLLYTVFIVSVAMIIFFVYTRYVKNKNNKLKRAEEEKQILLQRRYQLVIDNSDDMIYEISMKGDACVVSDKIREKFGWDIPKQVDNLTVHKFMEILHVHPDDAEMFEKTTLGVAMDAGKDDVIVRMKRQDGVYIWCRVTRLPLIGMDNTLVSIVGKIEDVDDEIREREFLKVQSQTDRLTGLLIKQIFEAEVRKYLDTNFAYSSSFIFVDMDHFKEINDKLGHSMGDEAIVETSDRLKEVFNEFDSITRFGGDEFCVFVKNMPKDKIEQIANRAVDKLAAIYYNEKHKVKITASIGIAFSNKKNVTYEEMFKVADEAMYEAKEAGRNRMIFKVIE